MNLAFADQLTAADLEDWAVVGEATPRQRPEEPDRVVLAQYRCQ
jgi:hypothetical protein